MAIISVSGNVGHAELKYTETGTALLVVSIADKRWNYQTQEEETEWIRAVWFGERAEKFANGLVKAKVVSVVGRENYKIYNDKIDRSIDPIDYQILAFKSNDDQQTSNQNNNDRQNNFGDPPPYSDNDVPFL